MTKPGHDMLDSKSPIPELMVPFSRPSSFDVLPSISTPTPSEVLRVGKLRGAIIRECGIAPGTYAEIDEELHPRLVAVYDGLMKALLQELSDVDAFDLCIRLYKRNEEYLGYFFRSHFDLAARRELFGSAKSSIPNEWPWERLSTYTESIRWLIEITLKYCDMQGPRAGVAKFDRLVELARATYEWDLAWEHVYRNVLPHELTIGLDFSVTSELTRWTSRVREQYQRALIPAMEYGGKEEFEQFQTPQEKLTSQQSSEKIEDTLKSMGLDESLLAERGYTLSDWGKFSLGVLQLMNGDEYCKVAKLTTLESHLSSNWNLDRERIPLLLRDYGLSKETVQDVSIKRLRPVEYGRRDTRLFRRPVVILKRGDSVRCLYGVETIYRGNSLILERLQSGRIDLVRQSSSKNLRRAVGRLQQEIGRVFEQNIADECKARGYEFRLEVDGVNGRRIPQDSGFGPVDVFVVDRIHRRFVLVEAKNVGDEGTVPREMQKERNDFSKFIEKLGLQVEWFAQRLADLKLEHEIPNTEAYSVEGVILVTSPRIWMFTYNQPAPILDFFSFFRCLERGNKLGISPV